MRRFSRALELNCLFLVVVALLVALQLILQRSQKETPLQLREREDEGEAEEEPQQAHPLPDSLNLPAQDSHPAGNAKALRDDIDSDGGVLAAPVVPNIHRSFPKRKGPYIRKGKKNKKKKKNRRGKQQQQQKSETRGGGGGGVGGMGKGSVGGGVIEVIEKSSVKVNKRGKTEVSDKTKAKV